MQPQSSGEPTLRPVAPDPELIAWLWSDEGVQWYIQHVRIIRHNAGLFATVKDDHECSDEAHCAQILASMRAGHGTIYDAPIKGDLRRYGISGVPREWKTRQKVLHVGTVRLRKQE